MIKDLYTIEEHSVGLSGEHFFRVRLNKGSTVYQGHFPEKPIAPGVCLMEMVISCARLADGLDESWYAGFVKSCRLLKPIMPEEDMVLNLTFALLPEEHAFSALLWEGEQDYMTMNFTLRKGA